MVAVMLRVRCTTKPFVLATLATVIVLVIGDGQAWSFTDAFSVKC